MHPVIALKKIGVCTTVNINKLVGIMGFCCLFVRFYSISSEHWRFERKKRQISNVYISQFEKKTLMQEITFYMLTLCFAKSLYYRSFTSYMLYTTPYSILKDAIIFNSSLSIQPIDLSVVIDNLRHSKRIFPPDYLHLIR